MENEVSKIQQYRAPMITATGIFLGFMLDFTTSWMPTAFLERMFRDAVIAVTVVSSMGLMIAVLYRMLKMGYNRDQADRYYHTTLRLFIAGVCIPFVAMIIIIIWNLSTRV